MTTSSEIATEAGETIEIPPFVPPDHDLRRNRGINHFWSKMIHCIDTDGQNLEIVQGINPGAEVQEWNRDDPDTYWRTPAGSIEGTWASLQRDPTLGRRPGIILQASSNYATITAPNAWTIGPNGERTINSTVMRVLATFNTYTEITADDNGMMAITGGVLPDWLGREKPIDVVISLDGAEARFIIDGRPRVTHPTWNIAPLDANGLGGGWDAWEWLRKPVDRGRPFNATTPESPESG